MKRILGALVVAALVFAMLNFIYSNLSTEAFSYPLVFKFKIPPLWSFDIGPFPLGFIIIVAFCLGILFTALAQAVPAIIVKLAVRKRERRIRELEEELGRVREQPVLSSDQAKE